MMHRIHAFEWEDLSWFPVSWRDYGTDYLRFVSTKFNVYKSILPHLTSILRAGNYPTWVDLASGGGSGLLPLIREVEKEFPDMKLVLTDLYPNLAAFERLKTQCPSIDYEVDSVSALAVMPKYAQGVRTIFGAFHHFKPDQAKNILQDAVDAKVPIGIFEPVARNVPSWLSMVFVPLNVLLFTPFIRPIRWSVLPFIYILPIIPLYILWDGVISILRTYSIEECQSLIQSVKGSEHYNWEVGFTQSKPAPVFFLTGIPKQGRDL